MNQRPSLEGWAIGSTGSFRSLSHSLMFLTREFHPLDHGDDFREINALATESHGYQVDARPFSCITSIASVLGVAQLR